MSPIIRRLHLIRDASRAGNLNGYEGLILRELSDHIGDLDGWFIKQEDLAAECGISRRTTIRTISSLMEKRVVITEERGRRKSLRYYIDEETLVTLCQRVTADGANETVPTSHTVTASHSGQCQRVTADGDNESHGQCQRVTTDSSQLPPKTPSAETPPIAPGGQLSTKPPVSSKGETPPLEEDEEDTKEKQLIAVIAGTLQDLEDSYHLPKSREDYPSLVQIFRQKIRPACRLVCEGRTHPWKTPQTKQLLEDLAYIAGLENGEYSGACSWGLIFSQLDRLTAAYEAHIAELENFLDGFASQIARGFTNRATIAPNHSPAQLAYIDRRVAEIQAVQAEIAKRDAEVIAANEATLPLVTSSALQTPEQRMAEWAKLPQLRLGS